MNLLFTISGCHGNLDAGQNSEILEITIKKNLVGQVRLTEIKIVKSGGKMQKNVCYRCCDLSSFVEDDKDIDGSAKRESDSISSQRELARSFKKNSRIWSYSIFILMTDIREQILLR